MNFGLKTKFSNLFILSKWNKYYGRKYFWDSLTLFDRHLKIFNFSSTFWRKWFLKRGITVVFEYWDTIFITNADDSIVVWLLYCILTRRFICEKIRVVQHWKTNFQAHEKQRLWKSGSSSSPLKVSKFQLWRPLIQRVKKFSAEQHWNSPE